MRYCKFIFVIYVLLGSFLMVACSQDEDAKLAVNSNILKIEVVDSSIQQNGNVSRAVTDVTYKTTFSDGDAIGIFAVNSDKEVFIKNVLATYNDVIWGIDGGRLSCTEDLETVTFYAYYPYKENITIDMTKEDPFETIMGNWTVDTDLSGDRYTNNDLMTGEASADGSTITFVMNHRMALMVAELPSVTYNFTNEVSPELPSYSVSLREVKFSIGEQVIIPYYDKETTTYRVLVNPTKKVEQIGGSFISSVDNGLKKYSIDATKLKAGEYIYCEIDGGLQTVDHELKVGDLIYSNGALASVDDNAPVSDDCVGVVYFVGNPMPSVLYPFTEDNEFTYSERQDALLRDHPGCTHGLVLGLKENTNIVFGEKDEIRVWYRTEFAERNSYIDLSPMGWDGSASTGTLNGTSRDQRLGYNHTEVIKKYAEAKNKSLLVNSLNNYNLVAPSISSGWFIPSVGDLRAMVTNWETMNTQLGKITGSDGLKNDMYYWSSTERNNTSIFGVQLTSSGSTKVDGLKYDRPGVSSRYVFAF